MSNELIKIEQCGGIESVSARELHEKLHVGRLFAAWIQERIEKYGFVENQDFVVISESGKNPLGGRPTKEYYLSIDMAKELCMVENNEEGRRFRQYFIEVEKTMKKQRMMLPDFSNPAEAARAWANEYEGRQIAEEKLAIAAPKVDFYDAVTGSSDTIDMKEAAKVLNMGFGRNKLFEYLRFKKVLDANNQPYQRFQDAGYFRIIESKFTKEDVTQIYLKTVVFQKGLDYIRKIVTEDRNNGMKI